MSAELVTEIEKNLKALHEKHDTTSSEYKTMHEKIKSDVIELAKSTQIAELANKSHLERIEALEQRIAETKSSRDVKPEDVLSVIDKVVAKSRGQVEFAELVTKAQTASQASFGGVLVNEDIVSNIIVSYIKDSSPMMQYANVVTIPRGSSSIKLAKKTLNLGAKFKGELQTGGETSASYETVSVNLSRIGASNVITEELLQGQLLINESTISRDLLDDISYQIQYATLRGDGLSKPKGLLKEKFLLDTAYPSNGQLTPTPAPTKVTLSDLIYLQTTFTYEKYREKGNYFMSYKTWADLATEKGADNHFVDLTNLMLGDKKIVIIGELDYGLSPTSLPVLFGDMNKAYTIVINGNYRVLVDNMFDTDKGLTKITASTFAGGHVVDEEAIRAIKGA